jgi:hypothetical protein
MVYSLGKPLSLHLVHSLNRHTRQLIVEEGGFLYDSDSYADDLPYVVQRYILGLLCNPSSRGCDATPIVFSVPVFRLDATFLVLMATFPVLLATLHVLLAALLDVKETLHINVQSQAFIASACDFSVVRGEGGSPTAPLTDRLDLIAFVVCSCTLKSARTHLYDCVVDMTDPPAGTGRTTTSGRT